jgi:hypothetical protein
MAEVFWFCKESLVSLPASSARTLAVTAEVSPLAEKTLRIR